MRLSIASLLALPLLVSDSGAVHAQQEIKPFNRRVVGGDPTDIRQHPWQVALQVKGQFSCGGSIIAPRWILTAAHCFERLPNQKHWRAKGGVTDYRMGGNWSDVERIVVHKDYNPRTYSHDIALIKVKSLPPGGKAISLASNSMKLPLGQPLEVTGWGELSFGGATPITLMKVSVPYVDLPTCNRPQSNAGKVMEGMLCAGYAEGGKDACRGDSGGPLVWRSQDGPVLVGIVSWGERCAVELKYGVYTRVSFYRNWIDRVIATSP